MTGHVVEHDRHFRIGDLFGLIEEFEDTFGRCHGGLQEVCDAGRLHDRLSERSRVLDEGLNVAQRHCAVRDLHAADHGDGDVVEVAKECHRRHDDAGDELGLEARFVDALVLFVEAANGVFLMSKYLDDGVAGV